MVLGLGKVFFSDSKLGVEETETHSWLAAFGSGPISLSQAIFGSSIVVPILLSRLVYGDATGGFSRRRIERATAASLAFRDLAGNRHPDHDPLATFRMRCRAAFEAVFVDVRHVARAHRLSRCGSVSRCPRASSRLTWTPGTLREVVGRPPHRLWSVAE